MLVDPGTRQVRHPYWGFLFVLLALVAFSPALHGGILIDDPDLFAANPNMESWAGLLRTWSSTTNPDYYPVTYTAFWVQRHLWGLDLLPYHLTSVLFHALDAFLAQGFRHCFARMHGRALCCHEFFPTGALCVRTGVTKSLRRIYLILAVFSTRAGP